MMLPQNVIDQVVASVEEARKSLSVLESHPACEGTIDEDVRQSFHTAKKLLELAVSIMANGATIHACRPHRVSLDAVDEVVKEWKFDAEGDMEGTL